MLHLSKHVWLFHIFCGVSKDLIVMRDGLDILLPKASFSGQVYVYTYLYFLRMELLYALLL